MKSSLKTILPFALGASLLASAPVFAGNCGTGNHGDYYKLTAIEKGTIVKTNLKGFSSTKIPNKIMTGVRQDTELKSDCTFTSVISVTAPALGLNNMAVFTLTGSWSYPSESKMIYFTLDGDISQGAAASGTWGNLFDPNVATGMPQFLPLLLNPLKEDKKNPGTLISTTKVATPLVVVYPSVSLLKGYIKLNKENTQATVTTLIGGKAIATSGITAGKIKEASFSFGATTKAIVSTVEPPVVP